MNIEVKNAKGNPVGQHSVAFEVITDDKGNQAVHDHVVAIRAGARRGTACTKTVGDVAGTNKKPWRQKGTGRARAGSFRSPLWRGGGVVPRLVLFGVTARALLTRGNGAVKETATTPHTRLFAGTLGAARAPAVRLACGIDDAVFGKEGSCSCRQAAITPVAVGKAHHSIGVGGGGEQSVVDTAEDVGSGEVRIGFLCEDGPAITKDAGSCDCPAGATRFLIGDCRSVRGAALLPPFAVGNALVVCPAEVGGQHACTCGGLHEVLLRRWWCDDACIAVVGWEDGDANLWW